MYLQMMKKHGVVEMFFTSDPQIKSWKNGLYPIAYGNLSVLCIFEMLLVISVSVSSDSESKNLIFQVVIYVLIDCDLILFKITSCTFLSWKNIDVLKDKVLKYMLLKITHKVNAQIDPNKANTTFIYNLYHR